MPRKSVTLSISIWDDQLRLSLIGKSGVSIDSVGFTFTLTQNDIGVRTMDPFELVYLFKAGFQQLMANHKVIVSSMGLAMMPGYLMAWDRETSSPFMPCFLPNNMLSSFHYQEFKFSSFFNMLQSSSDTLAMPNVALNLWLLSKRLPTKKTSQLIISGLDTWFTFVLSGCNPAAIFMSPDAMSELMVLDDFDDPLLQSLGLNRNYFPDICDDKGVLTKDFAPIDDGILIEYSMPMNSLISKMLFQYTNEPVAFIHLSNINHLYLENVSLQSDSSLMSHWVRFSSWHVMYQLFNYSNGGTERMDISIDDVRGDIAIPLDPFRSFHHQTYHMLNIDSFDHAHIRRLGVFQVLFLIKYIIAKYDQQMINGHIQKLVVSLEDWSPSLLQLCVDLCQFHGVGFKVMHWLDLIHICEFSRRNQFFSATTKQDLFKLTQQFVPSLDPLTCYSLYQEWEHWFNKLYDHWG